MRRVLPIVLLLIAVLLFVGNRYDTETAND
jgi:hypothetical protein